MLGVELVCDGSVQIPDGHIVKDSIIDRYLLSSAKPEEFDRSKLYDREFIKQHCGFNYVSVFFKYIFCIAIVIFLLWKLIEKLL